MSAYFKSIQIPIIGFFSSIKSFRSADFSACPRNENFGTMADTSIQTDRSPGTTLEVDKTIRTPIIEGICNLGSSKSPSSNSVSSRTGSSSKKTTSNNGAAVPVEAEKVDEIASPRQRNLRDLAYMEDKFDDGYDSDGELPFVNMEAIEGPQDFDEEAVGETAENEENTNTMTELAKITDAADANPEGTTTQLEEGKHVEIAEDVIVKMKKNELTDELKKRGCPVHGNKGVLLERLRDALKDKKPILSQSALQAAATKNKKKKKAVKEILDYFAKTAYWKPLSPNIEAVEEPANPTFTNPRAPTIDERDAQFVPVKHNFAETFDRPVFQAKHNEIVLTGGRSSKKKPKLTKDGDWLRKEVRRTQGCVNPDAMKKYKLSPTTTPLEYMEIFLPFEKNPYSTKREQMISLNQLKKFTNTKALLAGAGDTLYPEFTPFTTKEIQQHLGLYILNGLSPSPRVEYKFSSQHLDEVHGKDFVFKNFGMNAERRHRHFKAFFSIQDPLIEPPERKKFPNWKIRPLLKWMNKLFPILWLLGLAVSIDEMTMRFKGKHADKLRVTYKNEGDGFQCDALCQDGYCYQFYFRNEPAPSQYLREDMSPLHARVMSLFNSLKDDYHQCAMDNLYNSATFCKRAFNHKWKVLCHGVTRKGMRGLPSCVIQEEEKSRARQIAVRGTVKAAVLKGDKDCPDLVACSVYDTKPVHYLSMVSEKLQWIAKDCTALQY